MRARTRRWWKYRVEAAVERLALAEQLESASLPTRALEHPVAATEDAVATNRVDLYRSTRWVSRGGRSALGAATLAELGYTDVAHLNGGIKGWRQAGYPVVKPNNGSRP